MIFQVVDGNELLGLRTDKEKKLLKKVSIRLPVFLTASSSFLRSATIRCSLCTSNIAETQDMEIGMPNSGCEQRFQRGSESVSNWLANTKWCIYWSKQRCPYISVFPCRLSSNNCPSGRCIIGRIEEQARRLSLSNVVYDGDFISQKQVFCIMFVRWIWCLLFPSAKKG